MFIQEIETKLSKYLTHLSEITDCNTSGWQIFCAPVLHWLELDNHGRHLVQHALGDVADINIPAVAAARVVRRYQAQVEDELSLNVSWLKAPSSFANGTPAQRIFGLKLRVALLLA